MTSKPNGEQLDALATAVCILTAEVRRLRAITEPEAERERERLRRERDEQSVQEAEAAAVHHEPRHADEEMPF